MQQILKRIKKFEKTLEIKPIPQEFNVLIRKNKKWLCNEMGLDHGSVVEGPPTDKDLALVFPSHIIGPFKTMAQAQNRLEQELETLKKQDPKRFLNIASLQKPITSPMEVTT